MVARRVKGVFEAIVHDARDDAAAGEAVKEMLERAKRVTGKGNTSIDVERVGVTAVVPDDR